MNCGLVAGRPWLKYEMDSVRPGDEEERETESSQKGYAGNAKAPAMWSKS